MNIEACIEYLEEEKTLKVTNRSGRTINLELFRLNPNKGTRVSYPVPNGNWYRVSLEDYRVKNSDAFTVMTEDGELAAYKIEGDDVKRIPPSDYTDVTPYSSFIMITGYQGSGTSVLLKSFRYFGAHSGDDSGWFANRKAHESVNMRMFFNYIISKDYEYEMKVKSFYAAMGAYRYKKDKVNVLKSLHIDKYSTKLVDFLPNLKFISVFKHKDNNPITPEGKNFTKADEVEILKTQNPKLEGQPIFHLDWNRYFTDMNYCQKVLNYVGIKVQLDENKFNEMLTGINFDIKKLARTLHNS